MDGTWRIIPVSKWLVTPIYKPFRRFGRGTTLLRDLLAMVINHLLTGMILQVWEIPNNQSPGGFLNSWPNERSPIVARWKGYFFIHPKKVMLASRIAKGGGFLKNFIVMFLNPNNFGQKWLILSFTCAKYVFLELSTKYPTGLTERTPKPEYLIAVATYLGVSWDSVPFNFWWKLPPWKLTYLTLKVERWNFLLERPPAGCYCWWKKSETTTWDVVNHGINYPPQLVNAGFLNHQQYVSFGECKWDDIDFNTSSHGYGVSSTRQKFSKLHEPKLGVPLRPTSTAMSSDQKAGVMNADVGDEKFYPVI